MNEGGQEKKKRKKKTRQRETNIREKSKKKYILSIPKCKINYKHH